MSISHKAVTPDFERPRIDEIMKAAYRERNEAIGQLFGFGFTVLKDALRGHADDKRGGADGRGELTSGARGL